MKNEQLIRTTLWLSFIFNLAAACLFAFPSSSFGQLFDFPQDVPPLYASLLSFVIAVFGFIYAWLARQPSIDQPLLFVGGAGKVCFFLIMLSTWMLDNASNQVAALAIGDLAFGSLWLWWLNLMRIKSASG